MPSQRHLHPARRRTWWTWVGYWALMFVVMHVPLDRGMRVPIRHGDKLLHVVAYFLLAWLGGRYVMTVRRERPIGALLVWGMVYVGYGAVDEWLQGFVGRTRSLGDWFGDVVGVALATFAVLAWRYWADYRNRAAGDGSNVTRG